MGEHEVNPVALESIEEPRPGRTRLDHHLEGPIRLEQFMESLLIRVVDADRFMHQLTRVAYDGDH